MISRLKNEKGVTLTSLVIYILVFSIIVGVMTTISAYFFSNVKGVVDTPRYISELNKFVMFFAADVKNYSEAIVTDTAIRFVGGPIYQYQNNMIYRDGVIISKYVINCKFTLSEYTANSVTKNIVNVNTQIGRSNEDSSTNSIDFTLKYW